MVPSVSDAHISIQPARCSLGRLPAEVSFEVFCGQARKGKQWKPNKSDNLAYVKKYAIGIAQFERYRQPSTNLGSSARATMHYAYAEQYSHTDQTDRRRNEGNGIAIEFLE